MIDLLIEEAIQALRLAGGMIPNYKILDDGSVYFYYGQENDNPPICIPEPGRDVG
jgi:hypothetical protein